MIYAIDFDGTLVVDKYPNIGEPKWGVIDKVKELQKEGHEICLWTCRHGNNLTEAVEYCKNTLGLEFNYVNSTAFTQKRGYILNKMVADYYIDDRAMNLNDFVYHDTVIKHEPTEMGLDYTLFRRKYWDGTGNDAFIKDYFTNISATIAKLEKKKKEYVGEPYRLSLVTSLLSKMYKIIKDMNDTDEETPFKVDGNDLDEAMNSALSKEHGSAIVYNDLYILNSLCDLANLM